MIKLKHILSEIDFHSKLSRGHKPDHYQLGTSEFKPFDEDLNEGMAKNKVQDIVDRVFPQIVEDRGEGRNGIPEIKFHHDIYALHSGIDDMTGEVSATTKAQWIHETNTIWIFYPNMENEEDVIRTVLHEFEHTHQDPKKSDKYREMGYENNPYEKAAHKAENKWKDYL